MLLASSTQLLLIETLAATRGNDAPTGCDTKAIHQCRAPRLDRTGSKLLNGGPPPGNSSRGVRS